jgi:glycosyltransferase involved in cell wall biosynthesis
MRTDAAILTGGGDRHYALGLAESLIASGVSIDFIGSDFLEAPELRGNPRVRFLNLRGDMSPDAPIAQKMLRVLRYYVRLVLYAAVAEPRIFHILWNNKIEVVDRTVLMLYYRLLGKRIVLTVHNVNIRKRDGDDDRLNRLTLKIQYSLAHHLFVHTDRMRRELAQDFGVPDSKVTVIPYGINNKVPETALTRDDARRRLALASADKVILFFGNIAPYKGVEYLVEAMSAVAAVLPDARLVIAGRPKGSEDYWARIRTQIETLGLRAHVIERIEYVADEDIEMYFKAADVLVLPYTHVFQSGVLFLGYGFGLPAIASDVASLRDDVIDGQTGFVCPPADSHALAEALLRYFASPLYESLPSNRAAIRKFAIERHAWETVAALTKGVYESLQANGSGERVVHENYAGPCESRTK